MNEFLEKEFYHNTVESWLFALLIMAGAYVISKFLYWFFKNIIKKISGRTESKLDDIIIDMIEEPIMLAVVIGGFWYGTKQLEIPGNGQNILTHIFYIVITFDVAWLITRTFDSIITQYFVPLAEKTENQLDDQILPIIQKSLKIVIWIIAIVVGLNNAGYNVGTLLAGLGIGGLAFAMAAKDSVSNLFGGITVLMDKPFKVGDRIIVGGFDGNVVEIGMRSTRLKTLAGRIVTIPNKIFTDSNIENVTSEPSRRIVLKLSLVYGTTPEKMEEAVLILENINLKSENTEQVTSISFDSFSSYSLDITFIYFIIKEKDVYKTQTEINTKILKEFEQNGLEFAFPTQIIYSK